jgi:hypothetical protein
MSRIVVVTGDLLFGSKVQQTLAAAGHEVELSETVVTDVDLLVVDLPEMGDLSPLSGAACPVLGYYSHVDPGPRDAALEVGIEVAVPRSRMAREMTELVAGLLGPQSD